MHPIAMIDLGRLLFLRRGQPRRDVDAVLERRRLALRRYTCGYKQHHGDGDTGMIEFPHLITTPCSEPRLSGV